MILDKLQEIWDKYSLNIVSFIGFILMEVGFIPAFCRGGVYRIVAIIVTLLALFVVAAGVLVTIEDEYARTHPQPEYKPKHIPIDFFDRLERERKEKEREEEERVKQEREEQEREEDEPTD